MLVTNIDYDEHKGRIAIGRVTAGTIKRGTQLSICSSLEPGKVRQQACHPADLRQLYKLKDLHWFEPSSDSRTAAAASALYLQQVEARQGEDAVFINSGTAAAACAAASAALSRGACSCPSAAAWSQAR
jgi:hypothetical protein